MGVPVCERTWTCLGCAGVHLWRRPVRERIKDYTLPKCENTRSRMGVTGSRTGATRARTGTRSRTGGAPSRTGGTRSRMDVFRIWGATYIMSC